jgi:two-component system response regulator
VGVIPDAEFGVKEIVMEKDDLLLAFTDGIADGKNADGVFFGHERLMAVLYDCDTTPATLLNNIQTRLLQFVGTAEQFDDITLLAVKRAG